MRPMQYEDNDEQPIDWSRIDQNQTKPGYYEPTISKKPIPRPKSQPPSHFKVSFLNASKLDFHVEKIENILDD